MQFQKLSINKILFLLVFSYLSIYLIGCGPKIEHIRNYTNESILLEEGKRITLRVQIAKFPENHPTGVFDTYNKVSNQWHKKNETYVFLNEGEAQIVLASDAKIPCTASIEVTGVVHLVVLNGASSTPQSYSRPWILVDSFKCL